MRYMSAIGFSMDAILPFFAIISALIMNLLPTSPFVGYVSQLGSIPWLANLNWFFPVTECIVIYQTWLACYGIFLSYKVLMKYIKLI